MYFAILGPLEVRRQQAAVPINGAKRRALLIALLANVNRIVPFDTLTAWLWPSGRPPRSAALVIQAHVSSLRQTFEPGRSRRTMPSLLMTTSTGYLMQLAPDQLDALAFEGHLLVGARLLGQDRAEQAADVLRKALALWRGAALCDVRDLPAAQSEVVRLEELRLTATVQCVDADLRLHRYLEVIPGLTSLIAEFPYHERLYVQLMTALAGCGRRAEALALYQRARRLLAQELGVEPGPQLRAIEQAILHGQA